MNIRIAITDDHPLIIEGIRNLISKIDDVSIIATYTNAQDTLDLISTAQADVLFLDVNLPKMNGIDLCKLLRSKMKSLKIIALSSYDDISIVKRMISNGANGYLLKNTSISELQEAIKIVLNGETYLQKEIQNKILQSSLGKAKKGNGLQVKLTRREKDVLNCLYQELTIQESAEQLFISPKTVETHRMNLMSKLGAKNSIGIIKAALERGMLGN